MNFLKYTCSDLRFVNEMNNNTMLRHIFREKLLYFLTRSETEWISINIEDYIAAATPIYEQIIVMFWKSIQFIVLLEIESEKNKVVLLHELKPSDFY